MQKISRDEVISLIVMFRISNLPLKSILDELNTSSANTGDTEKDLFNHITYMYQGVSNGYLSDFYETLTGKRLDVIGLVEELFPCPCCHLKTLTEIHDSQAGTGYDICAYCGWEDDGASDVTIYRSVNKGSITDCRERMRLNTNFYYRSKWQYFSG